MKKITFLMLPFFLIALAGCSFSNDSSVGGIIEVEEIKTTDVKRIADTVIEANYVTCYITPNDFDYGKLSKNYSGMNIKVSYYVTYEKTWTGWDFTYAGSPKYDVVIKNEDNLGIEKKGLTTTKSKAYNSITYTSELVNLENNRLILEIGSTNIQNKVIFTDIVVNYKCYK